MGLREGSKYHIYLYRTSFYKCPRVLIHWTASILLSIIQFRKCHHVQIIEVASILHLQWAIDEHVHATDDSRHD